MKKAWLKSQYWMLLKLLKWHRHFSRISSDGPPTGHYDTYWVYAAEDRTVNNSQSGQAESEVVYLLESSSQGHLLARRRAETEKSKQYPRKKIGPEFLDRKHAEIRHYYRSTAFTHRSIVGCFLSRIFFLFWGRWLFEAAVEGFNNWLYRRNFRIIDDRISVLRAVIALSDAGVDACYGMRVAIQIHGSRFLSMDDKRELVCARLERVLSSLAADGYLQAGPGGFRATGKTLSGLLELEKDIRRERSARFSQVMMIILTAILALSSVCALWFEYLDMENKPF